MLTRFDEECYRNRSQVETVMSMIKRRQDHFAKAKHIGAGVENST